MSPIYEWHTAHPYIPITAVYDLLMRLGMRDNTYLPDAETGLSETAIQNNDRIDAAYHGVTLWRNNVGALQDPGGRLVRYGLCNDTEKLNKAIKSSDAIGIKPVLITAAMVGHIFGQFVAREYKEAGWSYTGKGREAAQAKWLGIITAKGGDARFAAAVGSCRTPDVVGFRPVVVTAAMLGSTLYAAG